MAPIESSTGFLTAIEGRVVTMDETDRVLESGILYIADGIIQAVQASNLQPPSGFENIPVTHSGGTIYPGLIELHNHLPYNVLPLWQVPKRFDRREQWGSHPDKQTLITAPMRILGETAGYIEAVVRYVECKALVAGTTTSQGITLFSAPGSQRFYRGIVRNVENTDDPILPDARTKIGDVDPDDVVSFLNRISPPGPCFLLHLAEGVDDRARRHFEALRLSNGSWAITPLLAGIHSLGLQTDDHVIYGNHQKAIVWSPLSNMLLYGSTLNLHSIKASGIRLGLGSDWSPSGSKNLFNEMKIARLVNSLQGDVYSDQEIFEMATRQAANILGWDKAIGSLEKGKYADYMVISGKQGDPYETFFVSSEKDISLVVIHGVPRFGLPSLMLKLGGGTESIFIGSEERVLNLADVNADPIVAGLSLTEAQTKLKDGLANLATVGSQVANRMRSLTAESVNPLELQPQWMLLLDNDQLKESLAFSTPDGPQRGMSLTATDIESASLEAEGRIELDALTVVDDKDYIFRLLSQPNLEDTVKERLKSIFTIANKPKMEKRTMSISFSPFLDQAFQGKPLKEILESSPAALRGVTDEDADRLQQAFGITTIRKLASNRFFKIAQAILAVETQEFDPGPSAAYEAIFATAPDLGTLHPDRFREQFGGVMYRGRLDGTARVILVGQDPSTDETLARRAFVGFSGQRVQGLLLKLGINRSYTMVNTFHFGIHGQYDAEMKSISQSSPVLSFRNKLLDNLAKDNHLEIIIAIGVGAREAVEMWPGSADYNVFQLVHPSAPVGAVLPNWKENLNAMRAAVRSEVEPDLTEYSDLWQPQDAIDIPRFDLPFGIPAWHGAGGKTRSHRQDDQNLCWEAPNAS